MTYKTMRYFVGLFTLLFMLTGCQNSAEITAPDNFDDLKATSESVSTAGVGQSCGNAGDKFCASGLECVFDSNDVGTCAVKVVDANITCDKGRVPVCGQKGREQVSYLNKCEAERHGADIVYEGFCRVDEDVAGSCGEKVFSVGNCGTRLEGFEYNITEGSCASVVVRGCEVQAPFNTLEDCQTSCIEG